VQIFCFADNLNILGESLGVAAKIGLQMNVEKTKILETLDSDPPKDVFKSIVFEKVEEFQYLGALLSTKND